MKSLKVFAGAGLCLALAALQASAQPAQSPVLPVGNPLRGSTNCPPAQIVLPDCPKYSPSNPPPLVDPNNPNATPPNAQQPGQQPQTPSPADMNAEAAARGTNPVASSDPGLFGDLIGVQGVQTIQSHTTSGNGHPAQPSAKVIAPLPARAAFKITENESPRPMDRVFLDYNYYNGVDQLLRGTPNSNADLHREVVGFEKTFLDGNASFGLRLPFLELVSTNNALEDSHVGDLSLLFKYAFINNRETGNVLSGGMVLTLPTGEAIVVEGDSSIHSTIFQPFVGWIWHLSKDVYFQGFTSLAVPTDNRDVTLLFNSIAVGYHLWRADEPDARLRGIIPVVELHINDPLNHRGLDNTPIGFVDSVDFTGGVYLQFRHATMGVSLGTPLTGPKPYQFEVAASLNFHF